MPPIIDAGGLQGSGSSGSAAWGSVPQKTDWGEFQSLPLPPLKASSIDGAQPSAAAPYHGGFLGQLTYERQQAEQLRYEADQQAALRGAVVGAGAALVIWSGGTALLALEEVAVLGSAIGTTATQVAATSAVRTATVVVPLLLGEYSIIEGLRRNDPGRIADGIMLAMSGAPPSRAELDAIRTEASTAGASLNKLLTGKMMRRFYQLRDDVTIPGRWRFPLLAGGINASRPAAGGSRGGSARAARAPRAP